jgi:hypothetical protein
LKFSLPEEENDHRLALDGGKWACVVWAVQRHVHDALKYDGTLTPAARAALENVRGILAQEMSDRGLQDNG